MHVRVEEDDDVLIVRFTVDKIVAETEIQAAGKELIAIANAAPADKKLLLSLKGVTTMSSAMIGKLVVFNKRLRDRGIAVQYCEVSSGVQDVFKAIRLNMAFDGKNPGPNDDRYEPPKYKLPWWLRYHSPIGFATIVGFVVIVVLMLVIVLVINILG